MTMRKTVTVIVPDELVYAMDPDGEYEFILLREKGRIVARPTTDYASDCRSFTKKDRQYAEPTEECRNCRFYDWEADRCTYGA